MEIFKVGDLVCLRGFNKTDKDPNSIPIGFVLRIIGSKMCKVKWVDAKLAVRFALPEFIESKKIELLNR